MLGKAPLVLAVSKRVPATSTKNCLNSRERRPRCLNYGSAGIGSVNHMAMELFKSLAGLDIKHLSYRAGNLAVNDLVGGHVDMFMGSMHADESSWCAQGLQPGSASPELERSSTLPDLPTLARSGVPKYELEQWWGIVVPTGTPPAVAQKLNAEINRIPEHSRHRSVHDPRGAPRNTRRAPETSTSI
mgnify:CR=1 FL=1